MKILIATGLYPPEIGGPATYAKLFEERLPRYGIEVSVLPFRVVRHLPPVVRHIAYTWKIMQSARGVDAILVQDTVSTGLPAAVVSYIMRKPLILRVPGDYAWEQGVQRFGVKENPDDFQKRSYGPAVATFRAIQRFVVGRARRVIAPSQYLARIVSGWVPWKKIDVIYNGIAVDAGNSRERENNAIVSSGRLVPWKGFSELVDVVTRNASWKLKIFGSGPEHENVLKRAGAAGGRIEILEQVSHEKLQEEFATAAVFVLNSRYEGLSHTLVEAMAAGTPVIATNVGGNPEVVQDGVNGFLIEAGDSAALERALQQLLSDESLRRRIGSAARERAKEFSIEKTLEATASLIKKSCMS